LRRRRALERALVAVAITPLAILALVAPAGAIYGGHPARAGEVPWAAALQISGDLGVPCTAVVIAPRKVLTAAHCVAGVSPRRLTIVTGAADVARRGNHRSAVIGFAVNPDYKRADTFYDDFAVLTLARPVAVPGVRLPGPGDHPLTAAGATLKVAGWGITLYHGQNLPTTMRVARVKALGGGPCGIAFPFDFNGGLMICGGGPRYGRGWVQACAGDSGGPVTATDATGEPVLVAITSFGTLCGDPVESFSRIEAVIPWIVATAGVPAPAGMVSPPRPAVSSVRLPNGWLRVTATNLPAGATMKLYGVTTSHGFRFPARIGATRQASVDLDTSGIRGIAVAYVQAFASGPITYIPVG
jgi:hypothetical protein